MVIHAAPAMLKETRNWLSVSGLLMVIHAATATLKETSNWLRTSGLPMVIHAAYATPANGHSCATL